MKNLTKMTLVAASLLTVTASSESMAKDFGKMLKHQVLRHVEREVKRTLPVHKPHCEPGRPCPPRRPYPQPQPIICDYYLGVWTTEVQIDAASLPQTAMTTAPSTHVVPGYGEPILALQIDRVAEHSPARQAGLEPGDVLLSANGRQLRYKSDLNHAIHDSNGRLELLVLDTRTGQLSTVVAYPQQR